MTDIRDHGGSFGGNGGGGASRNAIVKVTCRVSPAPSNPKEGEIWISEDFTPTLTVFDADFPTSPAEDTLFIQSKFVQNVSGERYLIDLVPNAKVTLMHQIVQSRRFKGGVWSYPYTKVFIKGEWRVLSGANPASGVDNYLLSTKQGSLSQPAGGPIANYLTKIHQITGIKEEVVPNYPHTYGGYIYLSWGMSLNPLSRFLFLNTRAYQDSPTVIRRIDTVTGDFSAIYHATSTGAQPTYVPLEASKYHGGVFALTPDTGGGGGGHVAYFKGDKLQLSSDAPGMAKSRLVHPNLDRYVEANTVENYNDEYILMNKCNPGSSSTPYGAILLMKLIWGEDGYPTVDVANSHHADVNGPIFGYSNTINNRAYRPRFTANGTVVVVDIIGRIGELNPVTKTGKTIGQLKEFEINVLQSDSPNFNFSIDAYGDYYFTNADKGTIVKYSSKTHEIIYKLEGSAYIHKMVNHYGTRDTLQMALKHLNDGGIVLINQITAANNLVKHSLTYLDSTGNIIRKQEDNVSGVTSYPHYPIYQPTNVYHNNYRELVIPK